MIWLSLGAVSAVVRQQRQQEWNAQIAQWSHLPEVEFYGKCRELYPRLHNGATVPFFQQDDWTPYRFGFDQIVSYSHAAEDVRQTGAWEIGLPYYNEALRRRIAAMYGDHPVRFTRTAYSWAELWDMRMDFSDRWLAVDTPPKIGMGQVSHCDLVSGTEFLFFVYHEKDWLTDFVAKVEEIYGPAIITAATDVPIHQIGQLEKMEMLELQRSQMEEKHRSPEYLWGVYRRDIVITAGVLAAAAAAAVRLRRMDWKKTN